MRKHTMLNKKEILMKTTRFQVPVFQRSGLIATLLISLATPAFASAPYTWNNDIPTKVPTAQNDNGKTVLFDVSHGGVEGNADWVIDGAFSDFADALVNTGYTVSEYRGVDYNQDGAIRFYDDRTSNSPINEAVIVYDAIKHADVFVLAETNRPFTIQEQAALKQFIDDGKGIFFVADHYDADRNLNTWDATEVFNGYNRSDLAKYNLQGEYGDWRNPKNAYQGWLVENFGIRFRFNGIDYKPGVSGIVPPAQSEGITQGVTPVLMAGGATLAIVDDTRAKGLVYFSESDTPTKWRHAKDRGLYFGGMKEGPYVAIAKSGAGKAAFIGDSSPIEDATPKYRRQDNGRVKKTYPGWTDSGNAAQLSINLINWLATPESYTHFDDQNGHSRGILTPEPMAIDEYSDPNNGQPWGTPVDGFLPWNTDTYKNNAFNAPFGDSVNPTPEPDPTYPDHVSVTQALAAPMGSQLIVKGVVTQAVNGIYGLLLSDEASNQATINVKLEASQRGVFNPELNPEIINRTIIVTATRDNYMGEAGLRYVSDIQLAPTALSVSQALNTAEGEIITLSGRVKSALNGIYALVLEDNNTPSATLNIKLESHQRATFSPELNPSILSQQLVVTGMRSQYMSQPGIREVSEIALTSISGAEPSQGLSVSEALMQENDTPLMVEGVIIGAINQQYALVLADSQNQTETMYIKLEASQRTQFSPLLNPHLVGKTLRVNGVKRDYMSHPGMRNVNQLTLLD